MVGASLNYKETKTFDNLFELIMNPKLQIELYNIDDGSPFKVYNEFNKKKCIGEIFGGNMCLIQCLIGTQYEPDYKNKILFFEEVGEAPYRIHRVLWQLKLAGRLDEVIGIVIGKITPVGGETEDSVLNACFDVLKDLEIPIIYNVHAGHIKNPLTVPIGAKTQIYGDKLSIVQPIVN